MFTPNHKMSTEEASPRPLLIFDIRNILPSFFRFKQQGGVDDWWPELQRMHARVKLVVTAARNSGFDLMGVVGSDVVSRDEYGSVWYEKREADIREQTRAVPYNADSLAEEAFLSQGVPLWQTPKSVEFRDALAALVAGREGILISEHSTFHRYKPEIQVATSWRVIGTFEEPKLELDFTRLKGNGDNEPRKIDLALVENAVQLGPGEMTKYARIKANSFPPAPPSEVGQDEPQDQQAPSKYVLLRGTTSSNDRGFGSLHSVAKPLRQALYARFGLDAVEETYPVWNEAENKVDWHVEVVEADSSMDNLLDDPDGLVSWLSEHDLAGQTHGVFDEKGTIILPSFKQARWKADRAAGIKILAAELHCAGVASVEGRPATTMFGVLETMMAAGEPVSPIVLTPVTNEILLVSRLAVARKVACKDCGQEFGMQGSEIEFYKEKGYDLPVRCPGCRATRRSGNGFGGRGSFGGGGLGGRGRGRGRGARGGSRN